MIVPVVFLKIPFSFKNLNPKNNETILDSWNNDKESPTLKFSNTIFVDNCIIESKMPIIKQIWTVLIEAGFNFFWIKAKTKENISPEIAHHIKETVGLEFIIICFKITASMPVKTSAKSLNSTLLLKINLPFSSTNKKLAPTFDKNAKVLN